MKAIGTTTRLSGKLISAGQKAYECVFCGGDIPVGAESYDISEYGYFTHPNVYPQIPAHKWRGHTECYEGFREEQRLALQARNQMAIAAIKQQYDKGIISKTQAIKEAYGG